MTLFFDDATEFVDSHGPDLTQEEYWASIPTNDQIREEDAKNPPRRGRAKDYSRDGVVDTRMSQTEVSWCSSRTWSGTRADTPRKRSACFVIGRFDGRDVLESSPVLANSRCSRRGLFGCGFATSVVMSSRLN